MNRSMNREELSLLLYLETRVVDHGGLVDARRMNAADFKVAKRWAALDFISFGRLASDCLGKFGDCTHWCQLSGEAWELAHAERKARAARLYEKRSWISTEEKRAAA